MTDEQRQRIHDIEYSCDSRAELAERIVALEDDNEKFIVKLNAEHIVRQNVEVENAKLRELCEDMLDCMEIRNAFERPPTDGMCKEFADRMRELGMEVD